MFNSDLVEDMAREKVALFLGAGVSASAATISGRKIANWSSFLRQSAELVETSLRVQVGSLLDQGDYLVACELMQSALGDRWSTIISNEFGQRATPSLLHHAIVKLDQRIIITTNFDKLIETACDDSSGRETHFPVVFSTVEPSIFKLLRDHSRKYIVKIHGTIDRPENVVFSRSEYIRSAFGNPQYSGFLESILLNYTVLFIGFSMNDPAITSLMEMYALRFSSSRPHYLFAPKPVQDNIIDMNKRLRKLVYLLYDAKDNHSALVAQLTALKDQSHDRRRQLIAKMVI